MKLDYQSDQFVELLNASAHGAKRVLPVRQVVYDSRRILTGEGTAFFALEGNRDGHAYIPQAYAAGVRVFVVTRLPDLQLFPEAVFLLSSNSLLALQQLAAFHRKRFSYPVVGITGSAGKTTVKEWIYHCLADRLHIIRSPKSYNSQLGVALSLLELTDGYDLALIEAGISEPGEMDALARMIQADYGILTSIGSAHAANFPSREAQLAEKIKLFQSCSKCLVQELVQEVPPGAMQVRVSDFSTPLAWAPFRDQASLQNLSLVLALAQLLGIDPLSLKDRIESLPRLALRMETFDGVEGITVINDTYNADLDALVQSLEYQRSISGGRLRSAVIGVAGLRSEQLDQLRQSVDAYGLDQVFWMQNDELPNPKHLRNQVVLLKGSRFSHMERIVHAFKLKRHQTQVEISLPAIRHNVQYWRTLLHESCNLLVMVKASPMVQVPKKLRPFWNNWAWLTSVWLM